MNKKKIGDSGEAMAAEFLEAQGHLLLAHNWRFGRYEIDLISRWEDTIVFTEVKTRNQTKFGYPEEFVDGHKQDRMVAAATAWMVAENYEGEIRFDIIAIIQSGHSPPSITHIPDAFFPYPE